MPFDDIRKNLEPVYAAVREASAIEFVFDREDRHSHANSHTFYVRYVGSLPAGGSAKVDITIREQLGFPWNLALYSAPTRSSRICRMAESSRRTRLRKLRPKKSWLSPIGPATNRATFTTSGISSPAKAPISQNSCPR